MTTDVFAQIASQRQEKARSVLHTPKPPELPQVDLPLEVHDPQAVFEPAPKLDTPQKLRRELQKYRQRFAKFQQKLAPALETRRIVLPLERFDHALEGTNDWQSVAIPHYGGPIGRATDNYRTSFHISAEMLAKEALFVCFRGVDYKAHVFLNDVYLGSHEGFFAPFEFDCTRAARLGYNTLLVQVENDAICMGNDSWEQDYDGDKIYAATGPGWDDPEMGWHHCPPGMGIFQPVSIEARSAVHIHDIFIRPIVDAQGEKVVTSAEAWIEITRCRGDNPLAHPVVTLELSVYGQNFQTDALVSQQSPTPPLGAGLNTLRLAFELPQARLWELDTPWLYQAQVKVLDAQGQLLDSSSRSFGMRSFRQEVMEVDPAKSEDRRGRYRLNGQEIRLRGANTMGFEQQDVLRGNWNQLRDDILLAKICHMNFWRLTQRPVQSEVYDFCDQLGFMTQTDLPLFGFLRQNQFSEAVRQAEEMERLVRPHPCNIQVTYINEPFPWSFEGREIKSHRHLCREDLERFFFAASQAAHFANPDRVIKPVDGDYDPPGPGLPDNHCYCGWYNGHGVDLGALHKGYWQAVKPGWYYGCGEFGSEGLDPVDLMRRRYPPAWLPQTPESETSWSPRSIVKAQTGNYHYMWFDTQHRLEDWAQASRAHQAWATRLMTEAFRRDASMISFAIHLFIDAFPSGWMKAIMDSERQPKPAYFAYREALTPLMVNWRSDRFAFFSGETAELEAWICNDLDTAPTGDTTLHYQFEMDGKVLLAQSAKATVPTCSSAFQGFVRFTLPPVKVRSTLTARLGLLDEDGGVLHDTAIELEVFPPEAPLRGRKAIILGPGGSKDAGGTDAGGKDAGASKPLRPLSPEATIVVYDYPTYHRREKEVLKAVEAGARLVFLELPAGEYEIAGEHIRIVPCDMNPRHFVSRATGHPLVQGFRPFDFRFWYDPIAGYVTPLLATTFSAEGWTPILTSGNGGWEHDWSPTLAAAEKAYGKGCIRICQVALTGRLETNPVARIFMGRLLV